MTVENVTMRVERDDTGQLTRVVITNGAGVCLLDLPARNLPDNLSRGMVAMYAQLACGWPVSMRWDR